MSAAGMYRALADQQNVAGQLPTQWLDAAQQNVLAKPTIGSQLAAGLAAADRLGKALEALASKLAPVSDSGLLDGAPSNGGAVPSTNPHLVETAGELTDLILRYASRVEAMSARLRV